MSEVAIVGIGMHEFGRHEGLSGMDQGVVPLVEVSLQVPPTSWFQSWG